jgi:cell division protein ZapA (FtsZ GTPase activity inhibitor)
LEIKKANLKRPGSKKHDPDLHVPSWLRNIVDPLEQQAQQILSSEDPFIISDGPKKDEKICILNPDRYQAAKLLVQKISDLRKRKNELSESAAFALIAVIANAFEIGALKTFHARWESKQIHARMGRASGKSRRERVNWSIIQQEAEKYFQKDPSSSVHEVAIWIRKKLNPENFVDNQIPAAKTIEHHIHKKI